MTQRLYRDENGSEALAPTFRSAGRDTTSTSAVGKKVTTDAQQLLFARQQGRVLLTHNRDDLVLIHETLRLWAQEWQVTSPRHAGILSFPEPAVLSSAHVVRLVDALVVRLPSLEDRLYSWRRGTGWREVP